ncbi:MAG: NADPH:quinone reductase [Planctomycetaceae bacterium]
MQVAYITQTGGPEVIQIGEQPVPEPAATQVLVKVHAVAVNPIDTYIRSGAVALPIEFPYTIGCDLAGVVETCGANVKRFKPGDRVWGSNQGLFGRKGSFSQFAAVDEDWLYPIPEKQSFDEAAAAALVGITAHLGLFLHANMQPGEVVFVNGGTGGVGSAVVQLAKAKGAKVIATVGSDEKKKLCASWGADCVLDYHSSTLDDDIKKFADANGGLDIWWETQREPTFDRTVALLSRRGRIVLMAGRTARPEFPVGPFYVKDLKLAGFAMFNASPAEQRVCATDLNELASQGKWNLPIGATFPLSQAADAHRLQEENTLNKAGTLRGKIVLHPWN